MESNCNNKSLPPIRVLEKSPYEYVDSLTQEWIDQLKIHFNGWKKTNEMLNTLLHDFFNQCDNPYDYALRGMANSGDFYSLKANTLSYYIMEYFSLWKTKYAYKLPCLTLQQKREALKLVSKQKNISLIRLIVEIFEMKANKSDFIDIINAVLNRKMYKEACHIAVLLELYDVFGIQEFVVPLIVQDKYDVACEFLKGNSKNQIEIVQFLDNLLGKKNTKAEVEKIVREKNIFDPKMEKMWGKPLSKLLVRIVKSFNLPIETCPNLTRKRGSGALQFLLRKRYVDKNIGQESWSEMVIEAVGDDPNLHLELVTGVSIYGEQTEAMEWAEKFKIPVSSWPHTLRLHFNRKDNTDDNSCTSYQSSECWDGAEEAKSSINFHQLSLPDSKIHLIDTLEALSNFVVTHFDDVLICGIDCEWKPSIGLMKNDVALLQIATLEAVYIIDVLTLLSITSNEIWESFYKKIFLNHDILKIGFGLANDFFMLRDILPPAVKNISPTGPGFVDLMTLWKILSQKWNFQFPFPNQSGHATGSESLNRLVELSLGERLDKSNQFSNWERRPLRESQIKYAALDAYCLLEIYDVLRSESENQNIPFLEVVSSAVEEDEREGKSKKLKGKRQTSD